VRPLSEIRKGIEMLADGERKERLRLWLEQEVAWFEERLLRVSAAGADALGRAPRQGFKPAPGHHQPARSDGAPHGLRLVTRNSQDSRSWKSRS
jgi:hypothetical protein